MAPFGRESRQFSEPLPVGSAACFPRYGPDRLNDRPGDLEKSAYDGGYNLENGFYGLPNGEEKRLYFLPNGLDKLPGGGENAANGRPNRLDAGEDVGLAR